ncbi:deleted in malignant brain tumors 1 protein-like [Cynoglossus semilaevis]|nr:deleted in malignant brain tumors 1 protein-like [Cynoglossus semilaevis]XP_008335612.1 deleted in malignant brain tumors 1 protein-like [Cynoglossus semilaevis]
MAPVPAVNQQFVLYLSIGLLSLLLLTECDKIKLNGPSRCSGRVEVYHGDTWGTVCDDYWSMNNAEVLCRELGCGTVLELKKGGFFGEGNGEIWLDDVRCTGEEASILKCAHKPLGEHNCGHSEDVGVICSEHLRVVNGTNRCNGRVEVYNSGKWKRVCSSDWDKTEADVVCQEINCGYQVTHTTPQYYGDSREELAVKINCAGNESSVSQCSFQDSKDSCIDATIFCQNSKIIRLVNGTSSCSGRVEVYHNAEWGTICDDRWGIPEVIVACHEMNCGNPIAATYKSFYGQGKDQVWMDDVECTGQEKSLADCSHRGFGEHDCDHSEDAGITCSDAVRLINGTDRCSGRLEVFYNGYWGPVCSHSWTIEQAKVVCAEIACGAPKKIEESPDYGKSSGRSFTSRCIGNVSSIAECHLQEYSGKCEGVSLSCSDVSQMRLVNGTNRCSGRVEIMHNSQWGTVCDDEWSIMNARVVCRVMDCGTAQTAKSNSFFGPGDGDIWLDDVKCLGNESSLLHCEHNKMGENNCGHLEDAGVVCSVSIRLTNGTDHCSGRVEVFSGGLWLPAYNLNWGMNEASVACRETNCGDPLNVLWNYGESKDQRGLRISCRGGESSLTQCSLTTHTRTSQERLENVGIKCSGNLRLVGGENRCVGRVEYFNEGQWGTICGESWDFNDAGVVCRQLNCGKAFKMTTMTEFGSATSQQIVDTFQCNGYESTISQCTMTKVQDRICNATSIAGAMCKEALEVRLVKENDECSGRVELRHNDVWQTVCDSQWTMSKAQVVCELIECGYAMNAPGAAHFGQGTGPVVEATNLCFDNATSLKQCTKKGFTTARCGHEHDAGVVCAAMVRLVGGSGQCSGRVEVLYKGSWGTVCDDEWQISNADVVCRQLGCGHAVSAPMNAHFGRGSGPIWLDNVECTGQESALTHCPHNGFGENNCGHGEDASVICLGSLQKPEITLSPGTEVNWGDRVEITCALPSEPSGGTFILKKTQGAFKMEKFSESETANFAFSSVDFSLNGSYFCEYQKKLPDQVLYYPQGIPADLSVGVKLEKPSISITSPHSMVVYSPDQIAVSKGAVFSITCSTYSKYSEGVFYLTKSKVNTTKMKMSVGHSVFHMAYFEFPQVDFQHQGEYTCVYSVNLSSITFNSIPSSSLQITVVSSTTSGVVTGLVVGLVVLLVVAVGIFLWRRRWRGAGAMVQFSNKFGGPVKQDVQDRSNGAYNERNSSTLDDHGGQGSSPEDKSVDAQPENTLETEPEDLAGRVCYELEPLVLS